MKRVLRLSLFALLFLLPSLSQAASRTEYILDVSGSMNAMFGGEKRIDSARKSIATAVQGIPDGSIVALRLYSHRLPPGDKAASCKDTELVVPFAPINKQQIVGIVNAANPLGQTPIAYSLEQAANDFVMGADEQQTIILVSDGEESCGGDPVAVAKALIAKGFKLKINVIGLDVDAAAKNQLAAIATATGGQYFDAKDPSSLSGSLQKLTQESLVIQKAGASVYGEEIRGGDNYETAVPLMVGKLYRLNHHQKVNQYDYFYVDGKPGQKITAIIETGEKGVEIKPDNTYQEGDRPYAGIGLHSPQKTEIKREEIIGGKNDSRRIIYPVPLGGEGRYYILIGSAYDSQHKDHRFKVEIAEQFDAGTKQDAGETRDSAIPIQMGTIKGYLTPNDAVDTFKVTLAAGNLSLKLRPVSEKARLKIDINDSDGVHLTDATSPNEGAVTKLENAPIAKAGDYFVKVSSLYSNPEETEYNLDLNQGAAPVTDKGAPATPSPTQPPPPPPPTTATTDTTAPTTPSAPSTPTTPATPVTPPTPATPSTTTTSSNTSTPISKPLPYPGGGPVLAHDVCDLFKAMSFMEKVKFLGMWSGIPLVAGWLIGWIWGYIKGRKAGKLKAMKQSAATPPPPPKA